MSTLGGRLRAARMRKGWTQTYVCKKLNIPNSTLSGYERGYRNPDPELLAKFAELYEVTTDYLLGLSDDTIDINEEFRRIRESIPKWGEDAGQIALDETKKVLIKLIERGELTPIKAKPIIAFLDAMIEEFESDDGPSSGPSQKSDND